MLPALGVRDDSLVASTPSPPPQPPSSLSSGSAKPPKQKRNLRHIHDRGHRRRRVGRDTGVPRRRSSHHRREVPDAVGSPDARRPPHPSHVRLRSCLHRRWRRCAALRRGLRNHRGWATGAGPSGRAFRVQADARRILPAAAWAFPREAFRGEGGERRVGAELRGGGREACRAEGQRTGEKREETRRVRVVLCVRACLCGGARLRSDQIRRAPDPTDGQGRTRKRGTCSAGRRPAAA
jgi:hypothetical protein